MDGCGGSNVWYIKQVESLVKRLMDSTQQAVRLKVKFHSAFLMQLYSYNEDSWDSVRFTVHTTLFI